MLHALKIMIESIGQNFTILIICYKFIQINNMGLRYL